MTTSTQWYTQCQGHTHNNLYENTTTNYLPLILLKL
jgi:hypothetical protein